MKQIIALAIVAVISLATFAQEEKNTESKGEVTGKLFVNFNTELSSSNYQSGFEMTRAYFGYKYKLDKHFGAKIMLDIGSDSDLKISDLTGNSLGNSIKRYAYFKNAYMYYKNEGLTVMFGIAGTYTMTLNDKFWGYRYISKPFLNKYKFGNTADLGLFADYQINDMITVDMSFANGEGYNKVQKDNNFRTSVGATFKSNGLVFRGYYDFVNYTVTESTIASFLGYDMDGKLKVAAEFGYRLNEGSTKGKDKLAYSGLVVAKVAKKVKLFGRYDHIQSTTLPSGTDPWNNKYNGNKIIAGVEFIPTKKVNLALNYQGNMYEDAAYNTESFIFLNAQFAF